jgi:hypothetical protein
MPEPFRLFAPPPVVTAKLLLVNSDSLHLALSMAQVQQVLLNVPVSKQEMGKRSASVVSFRDMDVPVVLGTRSCPPLNEAIVVLIQTPALKTGMIGVACSDLPIMAAVSDQDWQVGMPQLPPPWQTDGKGYSYGGRLYTHATSLAKR